jgi:hypothetical protein
LRKATLATLLGWAGGFAATSPFQIAEVLRNSGPDLPLLLSALGYGFAVWVLITFAGGAIVWACIVVPVSLAVSPQWLLRYRVTVSIASICLAFLAVSYKVHVWTHFYRNGVGLMNFWIYACFAVVFSGITASFYLRFLSHVEDA